MKLTPQQIEDLGLDGDPWTKISGQEPKPAPTPEQEGGDLNKHNPKIVALVGAVSRAMSDHSITTIDMLCFLGSSMSVVLNTLEPGERGQVWEMIKQDVNTKTKL